MASALRDEFEFYREHQDELVAKYRDKYIVIKNGEVLGAYDDEIEAVTETRKLHQIGTFLVQLVTEGSEAYSQTFHSRVRFVS